MGRNAVEVSADYSTNLAPNAELAEAQHELYPRALHAELRMHRSSTASISGSKECPAREGVFRIKGAARREQELVGKSRQNAMETRHEFRPSNSRTKLNEAKRKHGFSRER